MKKLLLAAVLVLAAVILVRTAMFTAPAFTAPAAFADSMVSDSAAAMRLAAAVRIRSVSWSDSAPAREPLLAMQRLLESQYPRVHRALAREIVAGYSLMYTWRGTDTTLAPVVLMGHMDVVPVEAAAESLWHHGPFSGDIADGFIWGRGTLDDKVSVLATLEAVESLLAEGFTPRRTVILAFGHDEEVLGSGADSIVQRLRARGVHPEFVMDEGSAITEGIFPGVARPLAIIGVAEKGYASVELSVDAGGGHSSAPPRETTIGILAAAIVRLERDPFPARLRGPTAGLLDAAGRSMTFARRIPFANLWLFSPLIVRKLAADPVTDAMLRTTTAPTMISGSPKENVLPHHASAVVNFRIIPDDSVAGVLARVTEVVSDARVRIRLRAEARSEPSPVSGIDAPGYRAIAEAVQEVDPGVIVAPSLVIAATDSRHYAVITNDIYRFLPFTLRPGDIGRIHGVDERLSVADYGRAIRFMRRLVRISTGGPAK
jgi:carboxypeptidase PM20D1